MLFVTKLFTQHNLYQGKENFTCVSWYWKFRSQSTTDLENQRHRGILRKGFPGKFCKI